ncbi:MAG: GNAT family N-acetyltransferase [Rhodocyclaceae bacterium]
MDSQICAATPADIDAIAALARVVWQATYPEIISQEQIDRMLEQRYNAAQLLAELATPQIGWVLIRVDGTLAGFASTRPADAPGEIKLDKLYVDPDRQREGLGGRLIAHVVARARAQGCQTLVLAVNKKNERAIAAYRKNGFTIREAVCVDIGGGFVMDDFIMVLAIGKVPEASPES